MRQTFLALLRNDKGGTAIEYGLIAALVVMGAFLSIQNFANTSINIWNRVANTVANSN